MLQSYFDDSGTHCGARIIVWGGVIGTEDSFTQLETEWRALLSDPIPEVSKPALSSFHLTDCIGRRGEFIDYDQGERDLVRNRFRGVINNSGVGAFAVGVEIDEWDRQVTDDLRMLIGRADRCAFGQCVKLSMDIAHSEQEEIKAHFDAEHEGQMASIIAGARLLYPKASKITRTEYAPVRIVPALQAADTVANESYRYLVHRLEDPDAQPDAHLRNFIERVHDIQVGFMGGEQIGRLVEGLQPMLSEYRQRSSLSDWS